MDQKLTLTIERDIDATDDEYREEVADLLRAAAHDVTDGKTRGYLRSGSAIGYWTLIDD